MATATAAPRTAYCEKPASSAISIKQELQSAANEPQPHHHSSRGLQATNAKRDRPGIPAGKSHPGAVKSPGNLDTGARGRGRGRGAGRGTTRNKLAGRPPVRTADDTARIVEAHDVVQTRMATSSSSSEVKDESAEQKEEQTAEYSSSMRKSPRSKEVSLSGRFCR